MVSSSCKRGCPGCPGLMTLGMQANVALEMTIGLEENCCGAREPA